MKTFSLAALVASASAFAPSQQVSRSSSSALAAKAFADEIGAQMPVSYVAHKTISRWLSVSTMLTFLIRLFGVCTLCVSTDVSMY